MTNSEQPYWGLQHLPDRIFYDCISWGPNQDNLKVMLLNGQGYVVKIQTWLEVLAGMNRLNPVGKLTGKFLLFKTILEDYTSEPSNDQTMYAALVSFQLEAHRASNYLALPKKVMRSEFYSGNPTPVLPRISIGEHNHAK